MPAGATYEAIASTTLGSETNQILFSSLPQTYTNLIVTGVIKPSASGAGFAQLYFNGTTSTSYTWSGRFVSNGSITTRPYYTNQSQIPSVGWDGPFSSAGGGAFYFEVPYYADSSASVRPIRQHFINAGATNTGICTGHYAGTYQFGSAITSITIYQGSSGLNFGVGSTATVWGVTRA